MHAQRLKKNSTGPGWNGPHPYFIKRSDCSVFSAEKPPEPWPIPTRGHALRRAQRERFLPRGGKIPRNNGRVRQRGFELAPRGRYWERSTSRSSVRSLAIFLKGRTANHSYVRSDDLLYTHHSHRPWLLCMLALPNFKFQQNIFEWWIRKRNIYSSGDGWTKLVLGTRGYYLKSN